MTREKRIFCCGNIAYDLVIEDVNSEGGFSIQACPGGSVFNTSLLLARLGLDVAVIARLGEDFLSNGLREVMRKENISTRYIETDEHIKTSLAVASIDKKGDSSYIFYSNAGHEIAVSLKKNIFSDFSEGSVFHTGSAFSYSDHSFESALKLAQKAAEKKMFITYDPNWREERISNKKIAVWRVKHFIELANLLKLSDSDAMGITREKTLSSALKKLPSKTVLTMGKKGSLFWDGKKSLHCPAVKVKVVDTIGAGDGFTAGLLARYCLLEETSFWAKMPENLEFASNIAGMICSSRGSTSGLCRSYCASPSRR